MATPKTSNEDKLTRANKELVFQKEEIEKLAAQLGRANKELAFQKEEKGKRAAELVIANKELAFQKEEKGKRAAELGIANIELAFQDDEKGKRAAELGIANKELAFQDDEKGKRAAELTIANKELAFQKGEKGKRAAELGVANKELAFQKNEKGKRAAELGIANEELAFQDEEKEKRAVELGLANKELVFQKEIEKQLQKTQTYTRMLIETSLDPQITKGTDGLIMDLNEATVMAIGLPREKIIGTKFTTYFTEPLKAEKAYQEAFSKGVVRNYPLSIKHASGKITDVLYNASVYKDDAGNVLGVFAAARDVTEQKQASQYARSLIEASLDPLVTISAKGKITDVNAASIKVTGISREKLIGTDFSNYFTEPEKAQEGYQQVFEKGFVADYPLTIKHKNGNLTDVLYNASVYKDSKGNVLGIFAAARDVTEQKWAKDLRVANTELAYQNDEKEKRAAELGVANKKLAYENDEKEKRAAELGVANKKLVFENDEKEKRAAELGVANKELAYQNDEKEKRAAELGVANKELAYQNDEKEKRAAELGIANKKLAYENDEKEKRAAELGVANKELAYQNDEKEKRAAELGVANKKLAYENDEKEKRAAELGVANKELAYQNDEKEKRAAELGVANKKLAYENDEKEKRAAELGVANKELAFQNEEKEKRAEELSIANKELLAFTYISSHDLQEPLRKIQTFVTIILENENKNLSENGKYNFQRMQLAAGRMQLLIDDLLAFSRISTTELKFEKTDLNVIVDDVKSELKDTILEKNGTVESAENCSANIIPFQFRQLMYNLISNALKFSIPEKPSHILIKSRIEKGSEINNEKLSQRKNYCHITVKDNGIGFESHFSERIFGVFQKLHGKDIYAGTGIGLAIVKKIVENHNGIITATSELNKGATFDIYIPAN